MTYKVYLDKSVEIDFYTYKDNDYSPSLEFLDEFDNVIDLSSAQSIRMQWRKDKSRGGVTEEYSVGNGFTVSSEGILWEFRATAPAGVYHYDLEVVTENGIKKTPIKGKIINEQDTTHD